MKAGGSRHLKSPDIPKIKASQFRRQVPWDAIFPRT